MTPLPSSRSITANLTESVFYFVANNLYEALDFYQKENLRLRVRKANLEQDVVDLQKNVDPAYVFISKYQFQNSSINYFNAYT